VFQLQELLLLLLLLLLQLRSFSYPTPFHITMDLSDFATATAGDYDNDNDNDNNHVQDLVPGLGVIIADAKQQIISVNPSFTAITGYTAKDAIGRNAAFLQGEQTNPHAVEVSERREGREGKAGKKGKEGEGV
jgi:PAS domain-containing protein